MNTKKNLVTIKPGDKTFLFTRNLTNDKLNTPYIGAFKMVNVKNITVELFLPDTKFFPKFHAFLIKKIPSDTPLTTTWNYSTKEEYEIKRILQKKKGAKGRVFGKMENLRCIKSYMGTEGSFEKRPNILQTIPKNDIKGKMLRFKFKQESLPGTFAKI